MGEYPRLASFAIDTEKFCAMIDEFKNPKESKMNYHDDEMFLEPDESDIPFTEYLYDQYNDFHSDDENEECYVEDDYYDDSMDGDFDSAMRDAGFGTDEDYGYYGEDY